MTTLTAATGPSAMGPGGIWPSAARRPAGQAPGGGFSLSAADILRAVHARLVMVIFVWLLVVGISIGLTVLWITYRPEYRSAAFVRVESVTPGDPMEETRGRGAVPLQELEMLVKDQAVVVTNPEVLDQVLEVPEVKATSWYRDLEARKDPTLDLRDALADALAVTPIPSTSYMRIEMSGRVPSDLPTIANAVVEKYLSKVNELQKTRYRSEYDRLAKETDLAKRLLDTQNAKLDQIRSQLPASVLTAGGGNPVNEEMMTVSALQTELEMAKLGRKVTWESLRDMKPDEMPVTADMQAAINSDPIILDLRNRLDQTRSYYDTLIATLGENHRATKTTKASVDMLADRLMTLQLERLNEFRNQQLQTAQNDYYQAQEQEARLAEQREAVEAKQRDLDTKFAQYMRELEEREALNANYQDLLRQREYLNQLLRREKAVRITQLSRATLPKKRHSPQWILNVPIGVVVGLMAAVGLAMLLELADKSVRTSRDVTRHAGLPVLASIPTVDDEEVEINRVEMASIESPHSVIAEAFRTLRTNLFFSAPVEHQGVILVTSIGGDDGKTTVAINLAAAVAISGRRVLLIDTNFRRPALRKFFANLPEQGLSNVLIGQSKLSDVIVASDVPGLDVVNTGPTPPNPAELLGSSHLRELIADARSRYDQVILDGAPVLLVSDALVLGGAVDGIVMVCRFRRTSRGALMRARAQLDAINARMLGAVLNAVQTTRGGYFRKQYREFYDYQREEEESGGPRKLPEKGATASEEQVAALDAQAQAAAEAEIVEENQRSARGERSDDTA